MLKILHLAGQGAWPLHLHHCPLRHTSICTHLLAGLLVCHSSLPRLMQAFLALWADLPRWLLPTEVNTQTTLRVYLHRYVYPLRFVVYFRRRFAHIYNLLRTTLLRITELPAFCIGCAGLCLAASRACVPPGWFGSGHHRKQRCHAQRASIPGYRNDYYSTGSACLLFNRDGSVDRWWVWRVLRAFLLSFLPRASVKAVGGGGGGRREAGVRAARK